ncbi:PQQ-binding-like beta-propeller repeat protein [Sphingomonas sp. 28-63-12]|uniref:outer membrane protein assembly factor BamB family protein n=1 Tax=Sphingomonas sp. 28-63-12 TaxID=1970434 RepID=UPI000BDDC223|nr:MAG: dehydrogenase [Sphingomonas sp. 28-63-12]
MRSGRLWFAAVAVAMLAIGGCSKSPNGKTAAAPTAAGEAMRSTDELQSRNGPTIDIANHPGKGLFDKNCAGCHNGGVPKAPQQVWLEMMAPDAILAAMNGGIMSQQAAALSKTERRQIAEYLVRTPLANYHAPAPPPMCSPQSAKFDAGAPPAAIGWGHDNRRFASAEQAGLAKAQVPALKLKWALAYPAAQRARSQPAVGWGAIFVGSQDGTLYALDLDTGCTRWSFRASAEIRTAIIADAATKRLYFGDVLARAYAVDAMTGRLVWKAKVDVHPNATITGSPTLGGGQLFVPVSSLEVTAAANPDYACCTFRGSVIALDPATGRQHWKQTTVVAAPRAQGKTSVGTAIMGPSGAPVWGSPTYDAATNRVYFGSGENYSTPADGNSDAVFAVDATTGKRLWTTQLTKGDAWNVGCMMGNENCPTEKGPDLDVAASPLLVPIGGGRMMLVVGQKSGSVYGLDPANGQIGWQTVVGHGGTQGGVHFGMAAQGRVVYVPVNDMDDTRDGRVYDVKKRGAGLHAIDAATGKRLWDAPADNVCNGRANCDPGISAAVSAIPGVVFAGHLDGRFRAYDGTTGKAIWSVDTTQNVTAIGGVTAHGGGMSGPGATIAGGHVIVNSGYGLYYHMPGNLLMVFTPGGK